LADLIGITGHDGRGIHGVISLGLVAGGGLFRSLCKYSRTPRHRKPPREKKATAKQPGLTRSREGREGSSRQHMTGDCRGWAAWPDARGGLDAQAPWRGDRATITPPSAPCDCQHRTLIYPANCPTN